VWRKCTITYTNLTIFPQVSSPYYFGGGRDLSNNRLAVAIVTLHDVDIAPAH
jgi:hypothetical protein